MNIIIGLGNPGEQYENTWHNIGFLAVDEFIKKHNFPEPTFSNKFHGLTSEGFIATKKIIIAKPSTYMNESGKSARALLDYYKLPNSDLIVIHDDIDLLLGKIKISKDHGSAGHKGVESLIKTIDSQNFIRVRIGISPDLKKSRKALHFVLKSFGLTNAKKAKDTAKKASEAVQEIIEKGIEKAMTEYNK